MADSVTLAYVHPNDVTHSFSDSLMKLSFYDAANHQRLMRGGLFRMRCGSGGLVEARNSAVEGFLEDPADWLFWVDTDMGFEEDSLERLLAVADPKERPIVGGLCFAQKETRADGFSGYSTAARPTISDWTEVDGRKGFMGRAWYPTDTVVKCDATGAAFVVIHRSVLERMRDEYGTFYDRIATGEGSKRMGEDISFCVRAGALGFPIHVHTGVRTTHMKTVWLAEGDFWGQQVAPPATEPVDVLVPVLNRPQNALPFMQSLRASTGLANVTAIAEDFDLPTAEAWRDAGADVFTGSAHTFAEKINFGYESTDAPWVFLVGDDVRFHPGWLDHAQYASRITGAHVIGTNDLGNPRVMRGEHATHLLVRRSYIDEHGASWDGPKVVCHEGYRHWFVDDELVTVAKQRDVWAMALASKVEHLHPLWGKAEDDDTYRLGTENAKEDQRLFRGRCKAFTR